jgi:non-canonical poly(A) RNA polymerase PAPD5/7
MATITEGDDLGDEDFLAFHQDTNENEPQEQVPRNRSQSNVSELPPWMDHYTNFRQVTPLVALHNEIVGFCNLMSPMPEEMEQRNALVERFTTLAFKVFGKENCEVVVFGSQATGLCLPSSDIDIVIQLPEVEKEKEQEIHTTSTANTSASDPDKPHHDNLQEEPKDEGWKDVREKSPLGRLADALREEWLEELTYLEVIAKTKVPLVKFTHAKTNLSFDVSFVKETGPQAATLIKTFMEAMPPLRPLIFVLKYFLAARVLNEPYSGGVGSYMLQLMIVSFLQHRERDAVNYGSPPGVYNLGCLLLEFLELYGTKFNYCTTGISVRHDGAYFRKGERKEAFLQPNRASMIAVENPLDVNMDVGKASFRYSAVQRAFAAAYKVLLAHLAAPPVPTVSILATIVPPNDEMMQRKKAKKSTMALSASRDSSRDQGGERKKRRFR